MFYARVDEFWRKERKYRYLEEKEQYRKYRMEANKAGQYGTHG